MARDIEEFLRRAAERRKQNQGQSAPAPKPPPARPAVPPAKQRLADEADARKPPGELDPYRELPRSREAGPTQSARPPKASPIARQAKPQRQRRETVAEHVRDAIVVSDVTENASQLGEEVGLADEKLEARLEKFDHKIGDLEGMSSIQDDRVERVGQDKSHLAVSLLELLKQPQTVRQSILISEILKRPNFDD
jgi:hypothetical protein